MQGPQNFIIIQPHDEARRLFVEGLARRGRPGLWLPLDPDTSVIDQLFETFRGLAHQLIGQVILGARWRKGTPPVIHFDYVDDDTVNAFAFREGDFYFIAMNYGTLMRFLMFFQRALSPDFDAPPTAFPVPPDESGWSLAAHLAEQAFSLIVDHELGHIIHGHVDFMSHRGMAALDEAQPIEQVSGNWRMFHALEWDADTWSVLQGWSRLRSIVDAVANGGGNEFQKRVYSSLTSASFTWALALHCTYRLFFPNWPADDLHAMEKRHPPTAHRAMFVQVTVASNFPNQFHEPLSECIRALVDAQRLVELHSGLAADIPSLQVAWDLGRGIIATYADAWAELFPDLDTHSLSDSIIKPR